MSDQSPLIVPMTVEALVVNDIFRTNGNTFLRTQMEYNAMQYCANGQPGMNNNDTNFTLHSTSPVPPNNVPAGAFYNGVYLKWRLPQSFTHGVQDSANATTVYPPVPNRWLIVRYSGALTSRQATAWIVESDYLYPGNQNPSAMNASQVACIYVQPDTDGLTPVGVPMGRNVQLGAWSESGHKLKLTAVAPGNTAFAFYQPQCNNVFSFIDCLNAEVPQTLSYAVWGWFSDAADDPLASATSANFASILNTLGWTLPAGTDPTLTATWSLLYGSVDGVGWQNTTLPAGGAPAGTPVSIAVANTSVEALTALITAQAAQDGQIIDSQLLEAFQLDLIDVFDRPDGAAILAEKLHASFFQKFYGGYIWNIVDAPDATTQVSEEELEKERQWLAKLNRNQESLDQALRQLAALQADLYVMWWKYTDWGQAYQGSTPIQGLDDQTDLQNQLDPTISGSLAQQTAEQMTAVQSLFDLVPHGDTPEALEQAIEDYSTEHGLPAIRLLKRSGAPLFYLPNNPVVMLAGAGASGIVQSADSLLCRFASQLVTGFVYQGQTVSASTSGLKIPQPDLSQVSGVPWSTALMTELVQEFFFLDPNNATAVSAAIPNSTVASVAEAMSTQANDVGAYPSGAVGLWVGNPWHPLLLVWQVFYYPIGYGTPESPNWTFDNGQYFWNGLQTSVGARNTLQGLIQLSPVAAFNMEARIEAFLENNPNLNPEEALEFETLLKFVQNEDSWDLLSQALDGFNNQLQLGIPGVFLGPDSTKLVTQPPLPRLIGNAAQYPPGLGNIPMQGPPYPPSLFEPWRAGQFEFLNLILVDEWGQALWPVSSHNYSKEIIYTPPEMTPVLTSNSVTFTVTAGPAIDSISPDLSMAGAAQFTLTVNGVDFASSATVQWNGATLSTTFVSATQLTAVVPTSLLASAGTASVTVASGEATTNAIIFGIASGPVIGSLSPDLLQAGMVPSAEFTISVSGVGFAAGAIVQWNETALNTEFVDAATLTATVPASFAFAPGVVSISVLSGGTTSNSLPFTLSPGAAIVSLSPDLALAGSQAFTLTVQGVGFEPTSVVRWNNSALATTFVSPNELTAEVQAGLVASAGTAQLTESIGSKVLLNAPDSLIQLSPALLQPARLDFALISGIDDSVVFGPVNPGADPVCGWVLPNHLDGSLMAYDTTGTALGEMAVGVNVSGETTVCWTGAPGSPYTSLSQIAAAIPHFGPFLLTLSQQPPLTFISFLKAIDETLWTTVPMGASFDQSLAVLIGRPLAMVRARLQFLLDGPPRSDPSWQYTFAPSTPDITSYEFAIELGNIAQLDDGLIGYFVADDYGTFNVVTEAGATEGSYLHPIGADNNYIYMPFDGTTLTYVSMLVDPRAPVHATTGILPDVAVSLPPQFTTDALAAMKVTFRVDGILTDQQIPETGSPTILMPVPKEKTGQWVWLENDEGQWNTYVTAPNDTVARLSNVPPVLRRGLLQLSSALGEGQKSVETAGDEPVSRVSPAIKVRPGSK
jgi:hypothetical protein